MPPGPDGKPVPATGKSIGMLMGHTLELDATGSAGARDAAYMDEGTLLAQLGQSPAPARPVMAPAGTPVTVVIAKNDEVETRNMAAVRSIVDAMNAAGFEVQKSEIHFDRGPISGKAAVLGGYWSTYWYNGRIYGTEIARGLDVLELVPSQYLTASEIAAAKAANQSGTFNPQQQSPVSWPDAPVVARAYIDQLLREGAFTAANVATLSSMLDKAQARLDASQKDAGVAAELRTQAGRLAGAAAGTRKAMLAKVMEAIAARLS